MDARMEEVLEKVRKCLALSEGTSNEHEAKSAALMAQKLLARYNLEMKDVKDLKEDEVVAIYVSLGKEKKQRKHEILANIIAENYQVKEASVRSANQFCFLGYEYNVNIAKEIFLFMVREMDNLGNIYLKDAKKKGFIEGASEARDCKKSYIHGFLNGLRENLKEQRDELNKYSLVLVTPKPVIEAAEQRFRTVHRPQPNLMNGAAYSKGHKDGKDFNLGRNKLNDLKEAANA